MATALHLTMAASKVLLLCASLSLGMALLPTSTLTLAVALTVTLSPGLTLTLLPTFALACTLHLPTRHNGCHSPGAQQQCLDLYSPCDCQRPGPRRPLCLESCAAACTHGGHADSRRASREKGSKALLTSRLLAASAVSSPWALWGPLRPCVFTSDARSAMLGARNTKR